jgi:hypothetical protein
VREEKKGKERERKVTDANVSISSISLSLSLSISTHSANLYIPRLLLFVKEQAKKEREKREKMADEQGASSVASTVSHFCYTFHSV